MNVGLLAVGLVFVAWTWECLFKPKPKPKEKTLGQLIDQLIKEQSIKK